MQLHKTYSPAWTQQIPESSSKTGSDRRKRWFQREERYHQVSITAKEEKKAEKHQANLRGN